MVVVSSGLYWRFATVRTVGSADDRKESTRTSYWTTIPTPWFTTDAHVRQGIDADDMPDDAAAALVQLSWFSGDDAADQAGMRLCAI